MIEVEIRGDIAIVRMRHGKANALDLELCQAMVERLEELRSGSSRAVVLTGEGRIFSAGVDLPRVWNGGAAYVRQFIPALIRVFETVFSFPKPVVAAINGHAVAGGCVLACATDHRLMARDTGRIGVTELLAGVPFPAIALEIMRLAAAPQHFPALVYRGVTLTPEEAMQQGLVSAVAEAGKLIDESVAAARSMGALPAEAFALTKHQIRDPVLKWVREEGARFDTAALELWAAPKTLAAIREYAARTFKKTGD